MVCPLTQKRVGLGFLLRVQVVKVAEKHIEPVIGQHLFVLNAEMILAELAGRVALRFQQISDRWRPVRNTVR